MKHNVMLTVASLLSILFMTFHLTDDIVRGWLSGTSINLTALPICVVWLYGTLLLAERRSGYVTRGATAPAQAKAPIRDGSPLGD